MSNITTRKVRHTEVAALQKLARQTFMEAFGGENSDENMQKYLEEDFSTEKLNQELMNPESVFYFAFAGNEPIGYLKVNFGNAQTELKDARAMEIERIYVLKAYHGTNVGQVLYGQALEIAREAKSNYIWLGVWEKNHRAIGFYKKNGFMAFDSHHFKLGDDLQTDILMKLELQT